MKLRREHKVNIPVLVTTKESHYVMPPKPFYKKPFWLLFSGVLIYGAYISMHMYANWHNPDWCSPMLRKEICEADRVQRTLDNGTYKPVTTPDEPTENTETTPDTPALTSTDPVYEQ